MVSPDTPALVDGMVRQLHSLSRRNIPNDYDVIVHSGVRPAAIEEEKWWRGGEMLLHTPYMLSKRVFYR